MGEIFVSCETKRALYYTIMYTCGRALYRFLGRIKFAARHTIRGMGYGSISLGVNDFLKGKRRRRDTRRDRSKDAKDRREVEGGGTRKTLPEKRALYTIFPSSRSAAIPDLPVYLDRPSEF